MTKVSFFYKDNSKPLEGIDNDEKKNITSIEIFFNKKVGIKDERFETYSKLEKFETIMNEIKEIPTSLFQAPSIKKISLIGENINSIVVPNIGNLNLEQLIVSSKYTIKEITGLQWLSNLKILKLVSRGKPTNIKGLVGQIINLKKLTKLTLLRLKITDDDIKSLSILDSLKYINICNTPVNADFSNFNNLSVLSIYGKYVKSIPKLPPNLKKLYISGSNRLYKNLNIFAGNLSYANKLKHLSITRSKLSDNQAKEIISSVTKSIEILDLSHNYIDNIDGLDRLSNLKNFNIHNNYIRKVPESIYKTKLKVIDISANIVNDISVSRVVNFIRNNNVDIFEYEDNLLHLSTASIRRIEHALGNFERNIGYYTDNENVHNSIVNKTFLTTLLSL